MISAQILPAGNQGTMGNQGNMGTQWGNMGGQGGQGNQGNMGTQGGNMGTQGGNMGTQGGNMGTQGWFGGNNRCFGRNEERKACGTACEPTCANQNPICTKQCVNNVCQCSSGFVRDSMTRQCVRPSQCRNINNPNQPQTPQRCQANESFRSCGSACEPSCNNQNPICTQQCIPNVCQCSNGFIRDPNTRQCVRPSQCRNINNPGSGVEFSMTPWISILAPSQSPQRCRANESFRSCGSACEPTCQNPNPRMCTMQCIPNVCQCNQGFVRGPSGCIRQQQCRN
uniref:TIL domain-containing protein n=1 Tax=Caenorhabditis tropicalis TaxID=1561998 RepID=A0A1I7TYW5_9PELO